MLYQREIALVQCVLLRFVPMVQRYLFAVVDQPRVLEAELALQTRLISNILSERRSERAHDVRRELYKE